MAHVVARPHGVSYCTRDMGLFEAAGLLCCQGQACKGSLPQVYPVAASGPRLEVHMSRMSSLLSQAAA